MSKTIVYDVWNEDRRLASFKGRESAELFQETHIKGTSGTWISETTVYDVAPEDLKPPVTAYVIKSASSVEANLLAAVFNQSSYDPYNERAVKTTLSHYRSGFGTVEINVNDVEALQEDETLFIPTRNLEDAFTVVGRNRESTEERYLEELLKRGIVSAQEK